MTLRSGIENFLKAIGFVEVQKIIHMKNVYQVIDVAGDTTIFKIRNNKLMFDELKYIYGLICATVHTTHNKEMEHVTSLGYFPHFNIQDAQQFAQIFSRVAQLLVIILCLMFKDCFLSMYYKNRDIVLTVIDAATIKKIKGL